MIKINRKSKAEKLALSGMLIGISVIFGTFSIPIGAAKVSPVQHFVNVVGAIMLGPWYGLLNAFATSLIRNLLGTGSLLAFPGSMVGAFISGMLYRKFKKSIAAVLGELIGTGIIGAILAYPIATLILGKKATMFVYVIPFISSCSFGAIIAYIFVKIPIIEKILIKKDELINNNISNTKEI